MNLPGSRARLEGLPSRAISDLTSGHEAFSLILSESCGVPACGDAARNGSRPGHMPPGHVNPVAKSFYIEFLFLPERDFLNIIFCSLCIFHGQRGCRLGLTACVLQSRFAPHTIAPAVWPWFPPHPRRWSFSCWCDPEAVPAGSAFVFSEGVVRSMSSTERAKVNFLSR